MPKNTDNRLKRLERLKRLGVRRGTRHIALPPPKPLPTEPLISTETVPLHYLNYQDDLQHAVPIQEVVPGQAIENEHGQYFNVEARYPLAANYGSRSLSNLLSVPMQTIAAITGDDAWRDLSWPDVLFIDTETTGLEIAAGTIAFLIGVGYVKGDDFVVRQVFMRDFNEEAALLADLYALCRQFRAVATFNGKTFDLPLLENRFVLARLFPDVFDGPHLDLLHPSRRLWRRRLDNCKLATLEQEILGVERTQADVPGYFIPSLYRKYLVDGDARPMAGIFYHNEMDIVSMAALTATLGRYVAYPDALENTIAGRQPPAAAKFPPLAMSREARGDSSGSGLHPIDLLSVGLWHIQLNNPAAAERALKEARRRPLPPDMHRLATTELAYLLKRQDRRDEAESLWQELAAAPDNLLALEELAKHYEWRKKDYHSALICIDYALKAVQTQPANWRQQETLAAWEHRRARVRRKLTVEKAAG